MVAFFKEVEREAGFMNCPSGREVEFLLLFWSMDRIDCSRLIGKVRLINGAVVKMISHPCDVFGDGVIAVHTFNPIIFVIVFWDIPELVIDPLILGVNFRNH